MTRIFTLLFALFCINTFAQNAKFVETQKIAKNFFVEKGQQIDNISLSYINEQNSDTLFYIYNSGNNAFVIISGVYSMPPVLAYSTEGNFRADQINPGLQLWLDMYSAEADSALTSDMKYRNRDWDYYLSSESTLGKNKSKGISPLLTCRWNQDTYYNLHCPEHSAGPGGHCYAGCVATAMSMVMYYYDYPNMGQGSNSYYHPYYGTISADFSQQTYDWASMSDVINSGSKEAISTLMYHCGVAVDMYYTPTGSSAFTEDAAFAFQHYFDYRGTISVEYKHGYNIVDWRTLLNEELIEGHPVFYSGSGSSGGHAFVCDGYSDTLYHFNWGWGGYNNGYFQLENLNPGGADFSLNQSAIIGVVPENAAYCMNLRTFNDTARTFTDGSDASYYWNDTDCSWLIQPSNGPVVLSFSFFNTESGKDILRVYDGIDTNGQLLGEFSGNTIPPTLVAQSGSMFLNFITDSTTQGLGWEAHYSSGIAGLEEGNIVDAIYYPNPAIDKFTILTASPDEKINEVMVYDANANLVLNQNSVEDGVIDISTLPLGIYFVLSVSDSHRYIGKIIKE